MDDELPTRPLNPLPGGPDEPEAIWLVSYADDDDREMSARQISAALGRGEIDPGTIVWRDGMADWQPISDLPALKEQLRQFTSETAAVRKKRTVLGGFGANSPNLPPQAKVTSRLPTPASPKLPTPNLPAVPVATLTRGSSPGQPPRPAPAAQAKPQVAPKGLPTPPLQPPPNLEALDQATRQRKTLLGTGFKVPAPSVAGKLPAPRLPGVTSQQPAAPKPQAQTLNLTPPEPTADLLESLPAFQAVREPPGPIGAARRSATETPTLPLPPVRSKLPQASQAVEADDPEPPTARPAALAKPAQPAVQAKPAQAKPAQAKAPTRPLAPNRPSRPPPVHLPSEPPAPPDSAEPISLAPDSLESLSAQDLDSVVANLPPPQAPSAPALRTSVARPGVSRPAQPPRVTPVAQHFASQKVAPSDDVELEPESLDPESIEPVLALPKAPTHGAPESVEALSLEPDSVEPESLEPESIEPLGATKQFSAANQFSVAKESRDPAVSVALDSLNAAFTNEAIPLAVTKGAAAAAAAQLAAASVAAPASPSKQRKLGKIALAALVLGTLGAGVFLLGRQTAPTQAPISSGEPSVAPVVTAPQEAEEVQAVSAAAAANSEVVPEVQEPEAVADPGAAEIVAAPTPRSPSPETAEPSNPTDQEVALKTPPQEPEPEAPAVEPVVKEPEKPPAPTPPKIAGDPESESAGPGGPFDTAAASAALERAAGRASACRKPGDPSGVARVSVTFANSGRATRAIVNGPPFAGTATGGCIAGAMQGARIPQFTGERVTVTKKVVIQ